MVGPPNCGSPWGPLRVLAAPSGAHRHGPRLNAPIGFSKAYIYKFFPSKQAIGEAIGIAAASTILAAARSETPAARSRTNPASALEMSKANG